MNEIEKKTEELAKLLRQSPEYAAYRAASDAAMSEPATKALLTDYRKLQLKLQAAELSGSVDEAELMKLQKLGELLQLSPVSSEYLFAEYRLNALLGKVYKTLAGAVDADISMIDE